MKIQVLGTGCAKCRKLEEMAKLAAAQVGEPYEVEKISDINQITSFGVMMTPALAIDGVVKITGRVPTVEEVKKLITSEGK